MQLHQIIAFSTLILQLVFALYLLTVKHKNKLSNILLSLFFISSSWVIAAELSWQHIESLKTNFYFAYTIGDGFGFLLAPLILFYAKSMVNNQFKFKWIDLFHLLPYAFYLIISIVLFHWNDAASKIALLESGPVLGYFFVGLFLIILKIQSIIYVVLAIRIMQKVSQSVENDTRQISGQVYRWVRLIFMAYILISFFELFAYLNFKLQFYTQLNPFDVRIVVNILNLGLILVLFLNGMQQPQLFMDFRSSQKDFRYEKSLLSKEQSIDHLKQIETYLMGSKVYLDSNLTIKDLSQALKIHSRYISQSINENRQMNFLELINLYRVQTAIKKLKDSKNSDTVLDILYESGFNSKSVFNTVFKKITGYTPSEFRKLDHSVIAIEVDLFKPIIS